MKIIKLTILVIFTSAIISCSSAEEPTSNVVTNNNPLSASNSPNPLEETPEMEKPNIPQTYEMKEVYPVKSYVRNTPTEAFKTFVKATINKDAEGVKKTLSKGSLEFIKESADAQNVTVDAILLHDNESSFTEIPEVKNEKTSGDTATIEVENKMTGTFDKMPMVREDGEWKVALDKFMENLKKRLTEDMNEPPKK